MEDEFTEMAAPMTVWPLICFEHMKQKMDTLSLYTLVHPYDTEGAGAQ